MKLKKILPKKSGRNNTGQVTAKHQGGREKRYYRIIDFKRDKIGIMGRVVAFEYDPNRNLEVAKVVYSDGDKRYTLKPLGLSVGDNIVSKEDAEVKIGNSLKLANIPVGISVHNIELHPGQGGILVRSAGSQGLVLAQEDKFTQVKMPSGETRRILNECYATIGQLSNVEWKDQSLGKAGRNRHLGRRPTVRGTAQNPRSHPHGGGEGRSGEGMKQAKTPWGKPARGLKTRKKGKYSDKLIIQRKK